MVLKQADLARRLGVDRSAISRAIERGKLEPLPDGTIDTDNPTNKVYLSKWSAHRGKTRAEAAPVSPGRAAAQLSRARAEYRRKLGRYLRRKSDHLPADIVWETLEALFAGVQGALHGYADSVDLDSPTLEAELQSRMKVVLETRRPREEAPPDPGAPQPITLPDDPGDNLDAVRAHLDNLAAVQHGFQAGIDDGSVVSHSYARRILGDLAGSYLNGGLLLFPRRNVAALAAVLAAQGKDAARAWLRERVQEEIIRLERPLEEIREHLEEVA